MLRSFRAAAALLAGLAALPATATEIPPETVWALESLNGEAVTGEVTLQIGEDGLIAGGSSCNRYTGSNTATLPAFSVGPLASTRMACPDMSLEEAYLTALGQMTRAEIEGDRLVLTGPEGAQLVFAPAE